MLTLIGRRPGNPGRHNACRVDEDREIPVTCCGYGGTFSSSSVSRILSLIIIVMNHKYNQTYLHKYC